MAASSIGYSPRTGAGAARATRALHALGALVVLLALLVGVPAALAGTVGNPLSALPDLRAGDLTDAALVAVLAAIAWVAWAQFAVATVVELASAVRRTPVPSRIPGVLGSQQRLARALVTAVFLLGPASGLVAPPAAAGLPPVRGSTSVNAIVGASFSTPVGAPAVHTPLAAAPQGLSQQAGAAARAPDAPASRAATGSTVYTVPRAGDGPTTLWDIAQAQLGAGERWQEIWQLNEGREQPDGAQMTSPSRLRPGWTVLVPTDEPAASAARAATSAPVEVTVGPGDTLSGLAAEHGQADWRAAWHANAGRAEPGGSRFTDPNLLRPGWHLTLPEAAGQIAAAAPHQADPTPDREPSAGPAPAGPADQPTSRPKADQQPGAPGNASTAPAATPAATAAPTDAAGIAGAAGTPRSPGSSSAGPTAAGNGSPGPSPTVGTGGAGGPDDAIDAAGPAPADDPAVDAERGAPVPVALLGGGGTVLAAGVCAALLRRRRRRFRERQLGAGVGLTPVELAPMEKALLARAAAGSPDVAWLDAALRHLGSLAAAGQELPEVVAVRLAEGSLELVLSAASSNAPSPWQASEDGVRWSLRRDAELLRAQQGTDAAAGAPYPALVSVGYDHDGSHWLLDLERLGAVSLVGDRQRCLDLTRFMAAELAHNAWADLLQVDLAGFGAELAALGRVTHHRNAGAAVAALAATLSDNAQMLNSSGTTVLQGRVQADAPGDGWATRVLLVAPDSDSDPASSDPAGREPQSSTPDGAGSGEADRLQALLEALRAQRSRAAVALVTAGDSQHSGAARWQLHVDAAGRLTIPALDLVLTAQQVPVHEAADLAALIALAADGPDVPVGPSRGDQPWDGYCDAAGAPLQRLTAARPNEAADAVADVAGPIATEPATQQQLQAVGGAAHSVVTALPARHQPGSVEDDRAAESPATAGPGRLVGIGEGERTPWPDATLDDEDRGDSVLPGPAAAYLPVTATTAGDVAVLAPTISATVRRQVEDADPGLDADLAAWHDPHSGVARLTLLGPVAVQAPGPVPDKRRLLCTELVAYLAARPLGVTTAQLAADFWPADSDSPDAAKRVRNATSLTRTWLDRDPRSGQQYLPLARRDSGTGVYRLHGLLVDAELFRRLRLRGVTRGPAGVGDLQAALELVTGPPLHGHRDQGYGWLVDTPLQHEYTGMIVDVAHLVATHYLAAGDPAAAQAAAEVALRTGARDDAALLDLVAAHDAAGERAQAEACVRRILANHDAEVEEDLPPRTYDVLRRRRWLPQPGRSQAETG